MTPEDIQTAVGIANVVLECDHMPLKASVQHLALAFREMQRVAEIEAERADYYRTKWQDECRNTREAQGEV